MGFERDDINMDMETFYIFQKFEKYSSCTKLDIQSLF